MYVVGTGDMHWVGGYPGFVHFAGAAARVCAVKVGCYVAETGARQT